MVFGGPAPGKSPTGRFRFPWCATGDEEPTGDSPEAGRAARESLLFSQADESRSPTTQVRVVRYRRATL
jgi:hypothetical protein